MAIDGVNNMNAEEFYNKMSHISFFAMAEIGVEALTVEAEKLLNNYDDIVNDQNEYLLELDETEENIEDKLAKIDAEIEKLEQEIAKYDEKNPFSMSEEERKDYDTKNAKLAKLVEYRQSFINSGTKNIDDKTNDYKTIEEKAEDYGSTLVEKAEPLANTEIKDDWWNEFWGTTGKAAKETGEKGVTVGNNLLDKVAESNTLEEKIEDKKDIKKNLEKE